MDLTPSARPLRPVRENLWELAIARLEGTGKLVVDKDKPLGVLDLMLQDTADAKEHMVGKSWSFKRNNGQTVIVRDVVAKVANWINCFKEIGDVVVQYDPAHAALPWAAVRLVLMAVIGDSVKYNRLLDGIEYVAEHLCRNAVVEDLWKTSLETTETLSVELSQALSNLKEALLRLYAKTLDYLIHANNNFHKSTTKRVFLNGILASKKDEEILSDMKDFQQQVNRDFDIVMHCEQGENTRQTKRALKQMDLPMQRWSHQLDGLAAHVDREERSKAVAWISSLPYKAYHNKAREDVLEGTGQWLLENQEYKRWKNDSASSIMWLRGIAGSGKTKLTSMVIEDAKADFDKSLAPAPVYFYCSRERGRAGGGDPCDIAASLARQLATPRGAQPATDGTGDVLLQCAFDKYKQRQDDQFASGPLSLNENVELILELLESYKDATITLVVDAVDECKNWVEFLKVLRKLLESSPCLLKIFISSRKDVDLDQKLENYPVVKIESTGNSKDVELFIECETDRLIGDGTLLHGISEPVQRAKLRDEIIQALKCKADGMFRLVTLQLHELRDCVLPTSIVRQLETLPLTLVESYNEMFRKIESGKHGPDQNMTMNILGWLFYGQQQLPSEMFLLAVSSTDGQDNARLSRQQLLRLCPNLVDYDVHLDIFRFEHESVREFLQNTKVLDPETRHAQIAECCLNQVMSLNHLRPPEGLYDNLGISPMRYIRQFIHQEMSNSFDYVRPNPDRRGCRPYPSEHETLPRLDALKRYSVCFWAVHTQAACERSEPTLRNILSEFLFETSSQFDIWVEYINWYRKDKFPLPWKLYNMSEVTALKIICVFDLHSPLQIDRWITLTRNSTNWYLDDAVEHQSGRILHWLDENRLFTSQAILKLVGNPAHDKDDGILWFLEKHIMSIPVTQKIVEAAVAMRNEKVVKILLTERGSEIEITKSVVLCATLNWKHGAEVMTVLLDMRGKEIHITEDVCTSAAKNSRSEKLVLLLLTRCGHQVDINERLIVSAASNKYAGDQVMSLLLHHDGNRIQITRDVVEAAAGNIGNGAQIMALFFDKFEATMHIDEKILLQTTEIWGHDESEKILRIILAKSRDKSVVARILTVAAGCREDGREICHFVFDNYNGLLHITGDLIKTVYGDCVFSKEIRDRILTRPDIQVVVTEEAIMEAATIKFWGPRAVGEFLANRRQETILGITARACDAAAANGNVRMLALLRPHVPPSEHNQQWDSIANVFNASLTGNTGDLEPFVSDTSIPLDTKDCLGRSPLWIAASRGHSDAVRILLRRRDVDFNSLSNSKQSPIFPAAARGHKEIVECLLNAGAKLHFVDDEGKTVLQRAEETKDRKECKGDRQADYQEIFRILSDADALQKQCARRARLRPGIALTFFVSGLLLYFLYIQLAY